MTISTDPAVVRLLKALSRAGSLVALAFGLLVLAGWVFHSPARDAEAPWYASMNAKTALAFVLLGLATLLAERTEAASKRWARYLGWVVAAIGALTLLEHWSGWRGPLDEALVRDRSAATGGAAGRMSPATAGNLVFLGTAVVLRDAGAGRGLVTLAEWPAALAGLSGLLSVLGYLYGVESLYEFQGSGAVPIPTALMVLVCAAMALFARPERGAMRAVASDSPAGVTARRLLPAAFVVPALIGWVLLHGERAGWYDGRFGVALFASSNIVCFTGLVLWNAAALFRSDDARRTAEDALRRSEEDLRRTLADERLAQEALKDSEARKTAVMDAALDAIVVMDHLGNIADANGAAERLFGYARQEMVGRSLASTLVPTKLREDHSRALEHHLRTGEQRILGKRVEAPAMRRDGTEFPAEIAVVRIRSEGAPVFTGYIRDLTERRRAAEAEADRRAKEAAEEANAELEAFSYSVAHDLRAPLRAIHGFAAALLEDWGDRFDPEAKDHMRRIMAAAEHMAHLTDALLSLARLVRTEPRRQTVDLAQLARGVVDQLRSADPTRTVSFVSPEALVTEGDPRLLRALLENLLGNAWKFTKKRQSARIELGQEQVGDVVGYFVRDNGAGFDMAHVDKLFAPFRRLHAAHEFEGSGIGLATVQRIVRRHGGRVWAEGAEDHGATFHFTLSTGETKLGARSWGTG